MSIESLFAVPAALPVVPKVVQQLIQSFQRDDISIDEIAAQLAADPVLSAKTLRLANSAYFHVSRRIGSVDDALRMLGFVMVRNLVVGSGVAGAFKAVPGFDLPQFWRYSLHTACTARWLAQQRQLNTDLAFTVALVHGVGHLVMHAVEPAAMKALNQQVHPLAGARAQAEQKALGYHNGEVSAELAQRWQFPSEVVEALRRCPAPAQSQPLNQQAALVHLGAWRARIEALKLDDQQAEADCPVEVVNAMRMNLAWSAPMHTLVLDANSAATPLPDLAELSAGLEAMFE